MKAFKILYDEKSNLLNNFAVKNLNSIIKDYLHCLIQQMKMKIKFYKATSEGHIVNFYNRIEPIETPREGCLCYLQ